MKRELLRIICRNSDILFLKNYDKTCKYFNMFYEKLYTDIGLTDFQGNSFILVL